jgi:hypothetical protein
MAQVLRRDVLKSALGVALSTMLPRDLHARGRPFSTKTKASGLRRSTWRWQRRGQATC